MKLHDTDTSPRPAQAEPALLLDRRSLSPRFWGGLLVRAFTRSWGRDVMLYTGGVTFFALLAIFPAIAILIGFYQAVLSIGNVSDQVAAMAEAIPAAARAIFIGEIERLSNSSVRAVSTQSAIALVIGGYAAHRGFKALLAGLNLIHDEQEPHGFFKFNMLAFLVALAAFALFTIVSGALVTWRLIEHAYAEEPLAQAMMPFDGVWTHVGLWLGLTMLYRYAMSHSTRVAWKAAALGGLFATGMSALFSWMCAIYVEQIVHLGATYGSVGAVVVLLIWLSWNVNAVFYGGAMATELELAWKMRTPPLTANNTSVDADSAKRVVNLADRRRQRS
ncbi:MULTISPECIES: YihY/virulence factor BrkB family protein [unclassified Brevundimonas]|uniref:YihY/virulence factor BrkB family protein n=1 Tax=unclassified Brevundimonas TaxID=2622653 RepID=UPI0025C6BE5C|nr:MULTISPECIES: YihY/virulence factor BrkB family protein [unclassified Brevundimonas]